MLKSCNKNHFELKNKHQFHLWSAVKWWKAKIKLGSQTHKNIDFENLQLWFTLVLLFVWLAALWLYSQTLPPRLMNNLHFALKFFSNICPFQRSSRLSNHPYTRPIIQVLLITLIDSFCQFLSGPVQKTQNQPWSIFNTAVQGIGCLFSRGSSYFWRYVFFGKKLFGQKMSFL